VADTYRAVRSADLIYCCGGGIMGHPGGVPGGVLSLREAWEAALEGIDLEVHARTHPALAQAIAAFRAPKSA
jgi:ribulose-bisphosphate carboxylase large chain